jgi:hypothetical protein
MPEPSIMQTPRRRESGRALTAQFATRPVSIPEDNNTSTENEARMER